MITGDSGEYHFIVWAGGNYVVEPFHDDDPAVTQGVSTADIVFIRRHILGTEDLSSPYKIIAADANGSASISTLDIVITRSVILGSTAAFSNGRIWEFVRSDQIFPDPLSPFPFESTRTYTSLLADQYGQNFIAVKLGDVNNNWTPAP
ncbi:MAG: hypothetical protein KatS3mg031_0342 [Chitinophagales bacterium]|nr:MAG: hypothetical protein KatS3mg031_0342 [Chitinophagales bacterium]